MGTVERHYGMDWLRIGAFAILIIYHVGMVFVPWSFHIKLQVEDWVAVPMLATNPWRLALLFVVSGYASRALWSRMPRAGRFARGRSARLLIPLLFGIVVVIPPQPWVELMTKHGYAHGLGWFWLHDYFRFGTLAGIVLPTWQHLWFVLYLWVYTMALALVLAVTSERARTACQHGFDRAFGGAGAFLIPGGYLILHNAALFPGARETHALFDDGVAHAMYLPALLFGFGLAQSPSAMRTFVTGWRWAALVAVASYAVAAAIELRWPGNVIVPAPYGTVFSVVRAVQGWSAIAALVGFADSHWNCDRRWRRTLTEAVFPFYIIHQTVIVVVAWLLIPAGLSMVVNFVILVIATVIGCWAFYLIGRAIPPLRPLIGLRAR